jgi:hypothetical protein
VKASYAGSTRVSINLRKVHFEMDSLEMDCRVKPGNDRQRSAAVRSTKDCVDRLVIAAPLK